MFSDAQFQRDDDGHVPRLIVAGEIDLVVASPLRAMLYELVEDARSPALLDMTSVTFCDSTGINALVHAQRAAERRGVDLIIDPAPAVRNILRIVGLENEFHLVPHRDDTDGSTTVDAV